MEDEIIIPEVKRTQMLEQFITEPNDMYSDLDYDEIRGIDFYRAIHKNVVPLPVTMSLFEQHLILKISLERKGRQEIVTINKRPPVYYGHYPYPVYEQPTAKKASWISRIFRRRRPANEE